MMYPDGHYHVQSGDELLYGTYADGRTARKVARRIRRREDIDAYATLRCSDHRCPWKQHPRGSIGTDRQRPAA